MEFFKYYLDQVGANELLVGFTDGLRLNYIGPRVPFDCLNLVFIFEHECEAANQVMKEVNIGRIAGPLILGPLKLYGFLLSDWSPQRMGFGC